jgi:diguanylate cyclase (GGDEF)-like protein/PAS domain S-box-containing protein
MEVWIHPNPIAALLLIPASICGALAVYGFASRPAPGSRIFSFLMLAIFTWSAAYGLELSCSSLGPMLFFVGLEYIGITSIPPLWLMLTLIYTGRERFITARNMALLFIIPSLTLLLNLTNQFHHLYYSSVSVDSSGPFPLLAIDIGPWYIVFLAYYYICMILGAILLLLRLRSPARMYRRQATAMLIGVAIPWAVNILYIVVHVRPFGHLDLTPFAFAFTGIIIAWGIFRHRLFDVVPIAHDLVIESMDEGMVILDLRERIVDCNSAARRLFAWAQTPAGDNIHTAWLEWPGLLELLKSGCEEQAEVSFEHSGEKYYIDVLISDLQDRRGRKLGRMVLLHDISARRRAQETLRRQEDKFQTLFRTSRDAIFITTADGRWLEANEAAAKLFGFDSIDELKSTPVVKLYYDADNRQEYISLMHGQGFTEDLPVLLRKRDGSLINALISAVAVRDGEGRITAYQGTIKDVTQLVKYEQELVTANERLEKMLDESEQRNREITLLGEMAQWIQACRDMETAYAGAARFLAQMFPGSSGVLAAVDNASREAQVKATFGHPHGPSSFSAADCLSLSSGRVYEYDGSAAALICSHLGNYAGYYLSMPLIAPGDYSWLLSLQSGDGAAEASISGQEWIAINRPLLVSAGQELVLALANVKLRETLREQATRDPLTGLYNRRYMAEMLEFELRRSLRSGRGIGFIMGDLDHFKKFNDTYGHEAGDLLLKAVSNLMRGIIRVEDIACRYGGEEFLVILPSATLEDAYNRALEIHDAVEKISFDYRGATIDSVTISMGVSAFPDQGKGAGTLIAAADAALYKAKREGRNRVCLPG